MVVEIANYETQYSDQQCDWCVEKKAITNVKRCGLFSSLNEKLFLNCELVHIESHITILLHYSSEIVEQKNL